MVCTKRYAVADDLHLQKDALIAILSLNECLPPRNGEVWVTTREMTQRLIHCGVDPSLEQIFVNEAIAKYNRGGRLEKRGYKHTHYFRSSVFDLGSPKDQRDGREPPILPQKNYLKQNPTAEAMLEVLNAEVRRVRDIKDGIKKGEIRCEFAVLLFNVPASVI